LRKADPLSVDL